MLTYRLTSVNYVKVFNLIIFPSGFWVGNSIGYGECIVLVNKYK